MSDHNDNNNNERAYARIVRASWVFASQGARRHVAGARAWVRADELEARIKDRDERDVRARNERYARAHARKSQHARATSTPERAHPMSAHEIRARAFGTRAFRSLVTIAAPCALIAYPVSAFASGDPLPLVLWPAAYGYLVWDGWMYRNDREEASGESEDGMTPVVLVQEPQRSATNAIMPAQGFVPTPQEAAVIEVLHAWEERAAERKLNDVIPQHPVIDESGLLIPVTFAGRWTKAQLDAQLDQVRALLAIPDEVRTQVKLGGTADRALIRVRTRIRDLDLSWNPDRPGLGLDADSAAVISVDLTDRILVAGMSGSGKSVVLRVLMALALRMKHTVLAIIDVKVEGALWSHTARVECKPDDIQALVIDLVAEMTEREDIMRASGQDLWEPTEDRPRIIVVIDEGAEFMGWVPEAVDGIRTLAVRGRSSQIILWWATQKPVVTGAGKGLDTMISGQFAAQICLAVNGSNEARNVLGENATADGWHPEHLPVGGWALLHTQGKNREPNPLRVWFMTKEDVQSLQPRKPWQRASIAPVTPIESVLDVALRLSQGRNGVSTNALANELGLSDTEVHAKMRAHGVTAEPHAFAMGDGVKARGYRRVFLEAAKRAQEE